MSVRKPAKPGIDSIRRTAPVRQQTHLKWGATSNVRLVEQGGQGYSFGINSGPEPNPEGDDVMATAKSTDANGSGQLSN